MRSGSGGLLVVCIVLVHALSREQDVLPDVVEILREAGWWECVNVIDCAPTDLQRG
jgi:hypothetical protein